MRMELGGESVGSIDQEQKAVNSVDVNNNKEASRLYAELLLYV